MPYPTRADYWRYMQEAHTYSQGYGLSGPHNGDVDAFRHAYSSAEMTREYGAGWARLLGDLNEIEGDWKGHPITERNMDLWNNARGRTIGATSTSSQDSAAKVLSELLSDGLVRTPADARTAPENLPNDLLPFHFTPPDSAGYVPMVYYPEPAAVPSEVNDSYSSARNWSPPRDPLVFDLDGDGIEASGIDAANPVLFDHDADGMQTATGWINADDGLVALDLDGNGVIDTGRELFGDNTLLPDGSCAANGFQALDQYDTNTDGSIDNLDPVYGQIRVWRDANQDGVSQPGELSTLAELGISSISASGEPSSVILSNGNSQPWSGTFTRSDGSTGASGTPQLSGSLLLVSNNFYREFTDDPDWSAEAATSPQLRASGAVRDLREAMSLPSPQAQDLQNAVSAFSAASTRDAQRALLQPLIKKWADTSAMQDALLRFGVTGSTQGGPGGALHSFAMSNPALYEQISALERFNGDVIFEQLVVQRYSSYWSQELQQWQSVAFWVLEMSAQQRELLEDAWESLQNSVYGGLVVQTRLQPYLDGINLVVGQDGVRFDTTELDLRLDNANTADLRNALIDLIELNQFAQPTLQGTGFEAIGKLQGWVDALASDSPLRTELSALRVFSSNSASGSVFSDVYFGDAAAPNSFAGGDGNDVLVGGASADNLQGGTGNDTFDGRGGNDVISGDYHNTFHGWYGGAGNDTYLFGRGDGQDIVYDFDTTTGNFDHLVFKAGVLPADILVSRVGDHLILKIAGTTDQVQINNYFVGDAAGGWALEAIRFREDQSTAWSVADIKTVSLTGTAGNDVLVGYASDDVIVGNDGNDTAYGRAGYDTLRGGLGEDILYGEAGDDLLVGDDGNDNMQGGVGDDTFDGGAGNDQMSGDYHNTFHGWYGGAGNDTYLFGRDDGQDTIYDVDATAGNLDKIVFKAGVAPSDVLVARNGGHLVLKISGADDQIQISNFFDGDATAGWAVEEIRFTDDSSAVWTVADVMGKALVGGAANDTLTGYATDDAIMGSDGNDGLYGAAGNDILDGGSGADLLYGETGDDSLIGGAGDDNMQGGVGDDTFDGGGGNDVMSGDYHNTFHGWYAGTGNDTYLFGRGDGQDTIYDVDGTAGNTDKLVFKTGVAPSDILLSRVADHLVLRVSGSTDQVQISNYFATDGTAGWLVEEIRFTDDPATVWGYADIRARVLVGTEGNDNLAGQATDDAISGNGGNDTIYGRAGNDVLDGGAGDDVLYGEAGNDTLIGTAGNDNMQGGAGDDTFDGGAGNDVMSGDYHNTFQGWYAGTGNDTYLFGRGDGQDTIYDPDGSSGQDKVVFKAGVLPGDVQIVRSGDNLILKIVGTTDQILLASYFASDASSGWVMEEIRFTDDPSTVWLVADVKAKALVGTSGNDTLVGYVTNDEIVGNSGNDTLYGRSGNDVIDGGIGDDVLYGEAGNDTLVGLSGSDNLMGAAGLDNLSGGDGSDVLQGGADDDILDGGAGNDILAGGVYDTWNGNYNGAGNDTYLFGRGDGQDTLYDNDGVAGNLDKIVFKTSVAPADVQVVRSGDNLILKIIGTADQIQVSSYFANDGATSWSVEQICFADDPGQVWLVADVKAKALVGTASNETLIGYAGPDTIYGGAGGDTLYGRAGNDTTFGEAGNDALVGEAGDDSLVGGDGGDVLQGGAGNDTLDGGTGNDVLAGGVYDTWNGNYNGAGNDTYLFGRGDGQDTLYDNDGVAGNLDKIVFKTGVSPADMQVVRNGDNLILKITGTADQIQVSSYFASDASSTWLIEQICFDDDATQVWAVDDVKAKALIGTASSDTLIGYASDDAMFGGAGGDTIYGRAGNDVIHGEADADNLIGEAGDDSLLGGAGGDVLQGRAGNDTLSGGTGNDVLAGGIYDTWNGNFNGAGNDTYLFGRGDGQDMLYDNDITAGNTDLIVFASGVATSQVQFTRASNNLVLKIIDTTDQITVSNYFASGNAWAVEEIRFADSEVTIIGVNDVNTIVANGGTIP